MYHVEDAYIEYLNPTVTYNNDIDYFNFNTDQDIPNPGGPVRNGSHPSASALAAWNYQWGGTAME